MKSLIVKCLKLKIQSDPIKNHMSHDDADLMGIYAIVIDDGTI